MMVQLNNFFMASGSRNFIAKWAGLGLSKTWKAWTQSQLAFWEDKSLAKEYGLVLQNKEVIESSSDH